MYNYVIKMLPGRFVEGYKKNLAYCDVYIDHDKFIGFATIFALSISAIIAANAAVFYRLDAIYSLASFAVLFFLIEGALYFRYSFSADSTAKKVEEVLPDALRLMSLNLKSGMATEHALMSAARPEFGKLEIELTKAAKHIIAGKEINKALMDIPKGVKSDILERTISLIIEGIRRGGELSNILEQIADDAQQAESIQKEITAGISAYAIFIFFAAAVGAPLMFGISSHLVGVISSQLSGSDIFSITQIGGTAKVAIGAEFLTMFNVLVIILTSVFSGLIVGIIRTGKEKDGVRYIPIILMIAFMVFFFSQGFVKSLVPTLG